MDGCSEFCTMDAKLVFVTSQVYDGNLGGLMGADAKCQALAAAADLEGNYKAWVSTNQVNGSPATRFTQSVIPYVRIDGVKIAENWADLIDSSLLAPINVTELGGPAPMTNFCTASSVYTGTNPNGTPINANCSNWTSTEVGSTWGEASSIIGAWSYGCLGGSCAWMASLYCFQQ
jgi:hypothetical protein